MRVHDALSRYLAQLRADGRSPHTVNQCGRHGRRFTAWLAAERLPDDLARIDHETVAAFLSSPAATLRPDGKPKRATAANALRSSLRTFLAFAHAAGYAPSNAGRLIRRARCGQPPPRALTSDEQTRLLAVLAKAKGVEASRDHALFALLLGAGLRVGSALALDVGDLDLEAGEVRVGTAKGDRPTTAYLSRKLVAHLRKFTRGRDANEPLFCDRRGRRIGARHVGRRLKAWLAAAGIDRPASPHALRHSFAVRLLGKTGDLVLTQRALGHASISSTMSYLTAVRPDVRRALG